MSSDTSTTGPSTSALNSLTPVTVATTPGSSQSSKSDSVTVTGVSDGPTPIHGDTFTWFPLSTATLYIYGIGYHPPLPGQDPLIIIPSNSTTAKITDITIERDDVSLPIPSYGELSKNGGSSSQQLPSWLVQFSTRNFQPQSCLLSIFECFKQVEAAFISAASSIGDSLASVGALMMQAGIADAATAAGYSSEASS